MNSIGDARVYSIARSTLIDALLALEALPAESFVLVGAHAVYLRAPQSITSIPPFTLDGDLAANPSKIGRPSLIRDHLENAGFALRGTIGGLYYVPSAPPEDQYASKVDILVPKEDAHRWDLSAYGPRDATAIMEQPGLELTLVDHSPMLLESIDLNSEKKSATVEVAGTTSLLVAKGWKIGERYEQGTEAFSEVAKDIADIYRLLHSSRVGELRTTLQSIRNRGYLRDITKIGARHLRNLCREHGPGNELLRDLLGDSGESKLVSVSLAALVDEFSVLVDSSFDGY